MADGGRFVGAAQHHALEELQELLKVSGSAGCHLAAIIASITSCFVPRAPRSRDRREARSSFASPAVRRPAQARKLAAQNYGGEEQRAQRPDEQAVSSHRDDTCRYGARSAPNGSRSASRRSIRFVRAVAAKMTECYHPTVAIAGLQLCAGCGKIFGRPLHPVTAERSEESTLFRHATQILRCALDDSFVPRSRQKHLPHLARQPPPQPIRPP